ncbi:hypothetical protein [Streptomyces sp. NPDC007205]|uniref:hypothetical protein n=1 Tax=Streptomyces sp. NPDC007205 TaxID=3154316 RepID=UPI0033D5AEFE
MSVARALRLGDATAQGTEASDLEEVEVVYGEIIDDEELLPATVPAPQSLVDQHTILYPGQALPTVADAPRYTRRDYEVSPETARGTSQARGLLREYRKDWLKRNRVRKAPGITAAMAARWATPATCGTRSACATGSSSWCAERPPQE